MTDPVPSNNYRKCEFCGQDTPAQQIACWKCGLWKGHKYETVGQRPSKDVNGPPFTVDRYGSFAEAVIAHRDWLSKEIERLRTALRGIQSCSTCSACRGAATRALGGDQHNPSPSIRALVESAYKDGYGGDLTDDRDLSARTLEMMRRMAHELPMTPSERLRRVAFELSDIATNCPRELNRSEMAKIAARMLSASAHVELGQRAAQPPGDGA